VRVEAGRLVELGGAGGAASLAAAPLWFLGPSLAGRVEDVAGPPYELASVIRAALADGEPVAALEIGPTRDISRPADVVLRNFPYLG
jgi:hypothetical protein